MKDKKLKVVPMQSVTFNRFPSPWIRPGFSSWTKEILNIYDNWWQGVAGFDYSWFRKNHLSSFLVPHILNFTWSFLVIIWKATVKLPNQLKEMEVIPVCISCFAFSSILHDALHQSCYLWAAGTGSFCSNKVCFVFLFELSCISKEVSRLCTAVARTESRKACAIRSVLICCVGRLKTHPHRATRRRRSSLMIQYKNNPCVAHSGSWYIPSEMGTPCAECCVAVAMRHQ